VIVQSIYALQRVVPVQVLELEPVRVLEWVLELVRVLELELELELERVRVLVLERVLHKQRLLN